MGSEGADTPQGVDEQVQPWPPAGCSYPAGLIKISGERTGVEQLQHAFRSRLGERSDVGHIVIQGFLSCGEFLTVGQQAVVEGRIFSVADADRETDAVFFEQRTANEFVPDDADEGFVPLGSFVQLFCVAWADHACGLFRAGSLRSVYASARAYGARRLFRLRQLPQGCHHAGANEIVTVHKGHVLPARGVEPRVARGGDARIALPQDADARVFRGIGFQDVDAAIGGTVVDADTFPIGERLPQYGIKAPLQGKSRLVNRNNDGNEGREHGKACRWHSAV